MPTVATVLLIAVPALLWGFQPSQAVTFGASAAPLRRTGRPVWGHRPRLLSRAQALLSSREREIEQAVAMPAVNDAPKAFMGDSPLKRLDAASNELRPLMEKLKSYDITAGEWPATAQKLAAKLKEFESIWKCYSPSVSFQVDLPSAVRAAARLAVSKGPSDGTSGDDIKTVLAGFQSIVPTFPRTHTIIQDQSYLWDLRKGFRVMLERVKKTGWDDPVTNAAAEIQAVYDKNEALKKKRAGGAGPSAAPSGDDVDPLLTLALIAKITAQTQPVPPVGSKPVFPGQRPPEPNKPAEPVPAQVGWIGGDQRTVDENFQKEEAKYEDNLVMYEDKEMGYFKAVSSWALTKEEEMKWKVYTYGLKIFQERAERVKVLIDGFVAKLEAKLTTCA